MAAMPLTNAMVNMDGAAAESELVTFNIGGNRFQTKMSTLHRNGKGRLGQLTKKDPSYECKTGEFWFDRDPKYFHLVLQFYRTGEVHLEGSHCPKLMCAEMKFWGITDVDIADCCWQNVCEARHAEKEFRAIQKLASKSLFKETQCKNLTCRQKLWRVLEDPSSSLYAKCWFILSVGLILLSIMCAAVSTLPAVKEPLFDKFSSLSQEPNPPRNVTYLLDLDLGLFHLNVLDTSCLVFFSVDLCLRIWSTPQRLPFFKSFLFVCDLLFLIPGWVIVTILFSSTFTWYHLLRNSSMVFIVQLLTITRIFRVFRLGWYSGGFRILVLVLRKSLKELLVLGSILIIILTFYGFLVYCVEKDGNPEFQSAFIGFWWAVTTLTTVGYGDIVPKTPLGCVIGGACAVSGVIIIGLLIPILATNFRLYYRYENKHYPHKSESVGCDAHAGAC